VENSNRKDLLVITADANMQAGVEAILNRPKSLNIRPITFQIFRHPQRDPGCRVYGASFSQLFLEQFACCMIIFDLAGCGEGNIKAIELEKQSDRILSSMGWGYNAKTIVIDPELEIWVWSDSPRVDDALGWRNKTPALKDFLIQMNFLQLNQVKPQNPKKAVELILRTAKIPRSSNIYKAIAEKVSLQRCQDSAFNKFKSTLISWFPSN